MGIALADIREGVTSVIYARLKMLLDRINLDKIQKKIRNDANET